MPAAIILSLVCALILGSLVWLLGGSRLFKLHQDKEPNEILTLFVFILVGFFISFPLVFFVISEV